MTSCNSLKNLQEDESLLVKSKVIINNKKTSDLEVFSYINQRPNQKISLYVYNWAKKDFEKTAEKWTKNHPRSTKFIRTFFSEKQIKEVYLFNKKMNRILKKNGDPPVIVNAKKTKKSVNTLQRYYENKGFFDVEVYSKEISKGKNKTQIEYHISTKKPYIINDYTIAIESPVLLEIYNKSAKDSYVKRGRQFDRANFEKEQKRLTHLFRNSGIHTFQSNNIYFGGNIKDSVAKIKKVKLVIKEQLSKNKDSLLSNPFRIQKVTKIHIYTDYTFADKDKAYKYSTNYKGFTFYNHEQLNFNPKRIVNIIAITPNGVYKDDERKLTIKYLNDIKIFESPINLEYITNESGNLTANIYLNPLKKFGIDTKVDLTHSSIKPFGVLGRFGIIDRNVFKGLEILEISTQFSFLNVAEDTSDPNFNYFGLNAWEFGVNASYKIPRIFFPLNTNLLISNNMRPTTNISVSTSFQKNIGLNRQNITGDVTYNWRKGNKVKHQLGLLNVQYINNLNSSNYFDVFNSELIKLSKVAQEIIDSNNMDTNGKITNTLGYINHVLNPVNNYETSDPENFKTVQRVKERREIITEDILVPTLSYSYTYNGKENIHDTKFSFINFRIVSAGSITSSLVKQKSNDKKALFGLPIAQYIKTELEYKKYWKVYNDQHLVFRTFIGAAVPFGNSTEVPFSRSYRAGGSNDIRAWKTFELGPGSSVSNLDFNIGNLKLVSNLEYRFKVINSFYAALFVDAGNVWDLTNSDLTNDSAKFKGFNSIKEIAVGSGVGLRYDFDFLIFRTDFAFKTYEPYLQKDAWFRHYNFSSMVFNFGINYPF